MEVSRIELSLVEESSSLTWLEGARGVNFRRLQTFVTEKKNKCNTKISLEKSGKIN